MAVAANKVSLDSRGVMWSRTPRGTDRYKERAMRRVVLLAVTGAATVGFGTPALGEAPPGLVNHFSEDEHRLRR